MAGSGADRVAPPDDIEDRDPGLARERTDLAWTRTAISFVAVGAAMLRSNALAGLLVIVSGVAVWSLGQLSVREAAATWTWAHRQRVARSVTVATTLVALAALVLAVLVPGSGPP
ncbi:MAG: DUF202 domain-containing protein [Betaproteobacteria bacterium]